MARKDQKILIVDDDVEITRSISAFFDHTAFKVFTLNSPLYVMDSIDQLEPDLIVLDVLMPEIDGIELCRQIRQLPHYIPIIMLTSKADVVDKVVGLEMGADDYLSKPFSLRELEARIKAVLRRETMEEKSAEDPGRLTHLRIGDISMEVKNRLLRIGQRKVELTPKEFELMKLFLSNPGKPFSRDELLENVWGEKHRGYHRTIDSHINRLRLKVEGNPTNPEIILTVWGYGYKFNEDYQPNK